MTEPVEFQLLRGLRTAFYAAGRSDLVDECYRALTGDRTAAPWLERVFLKVEGLGATVTAYAPILMREIPPPCTHSPRCMCVDCFDLSRVGLATFEKKDGEP